MLPTSQTILDGSGAQIAQTAWNYDETSTQAAAGIIGHDETNYSPSFNLRGNLTSVLK